MKRAIYACDVGSVSAGNFAWARVVPGQGHPSASVDIDDLVKNLLQDIKNDMSIALGLEAPLFMPIPMDSGALNSGRQGEGNRSMFAPPGAAVATLAIQQAAWILRAIHDGESNLPMYTLDWRRWPSPEGVKHFLIWEAFVSGSARGTSHAQDAATAAMFFREHENDLAEVNAVKADEPLCMVHAAAIWAGWTDDNNGLRQSCLVLKPEQPYKDRVDPA